MKVTIQQIKDNPEQYKVCRFCGAFNKADNSKCHNCGTVSGIYPAEDPDHGFAPETATADLIENELDYRCYHENYLQEDALKIKMKVA